MNVRGPDAVLAFVAHSASQYAVDRRLIYLLECSLGSYGVCRTVAAHPRLFAAIAPICGGANSEDAAGLVGVVTRAFHGAPNEAVLIAEIKRIIEAVRDAGGSHRQTILFSGAHGICRAVCKRPD